MDPNLPIEETTGARISDHVLISLCMVTYNHEKFVLNALEGLAAQDYSPLEIVVSDDASTDKTWEIIQAFVNEYDGPHQWKINRNPVNLGVLGNCMQVWSLATGQLIVYSDGDDISLPERISSSYEHHVQHPDDDYFICRCNWMDEKGDALPSDFGFPKNVSSDVVSNIRRRVPGAWGTCCCHHRRLIDIFGPMKVSDLRLFDGALAFRSILLGHPIAFLDQVLVRYRQHTGGVVSARSSGSGTSLTRKFIAQAPEIVRLYRQMSFDLQVAQHKKLIDDTEFKEARRVLAEESFAVQVVADALDSPLHLRLLKLMGLTVKGIACVVRNAWTIKSGFLFRN